MMPQSFLVAMGLLAMMKERDETTYAHSKGTAQWARRFATAMRLSRDGIAYVELCALVHDVGKIALSDPVVFNTRALTETETEQLRAHPVTSEHILNQIPALQHCALSFVRITSALTDWVIPMGCSATAFRLRRGSLR